MSASEEQQEATRKRRREMITLRRRGTDWETIAYTLGYSDRAAACKDYTRAMAAARKELAIDVDTHRQEELERLDEMLDGLWDDASQGNTRAAETVLKIMEARRRYVPGVEAPIQHEVITVDNVDRAIAQLREELALNDPAATADADSDA